MKMKSCSLTIVCVIILVVILFMMFSGSNNNMYGLIEGMNTKNTTKDKNKNINPIKKAFETMGPVSTALTPGGMFLVGNGDGKENFEVRQPIGYADIVESKSDSWNLSKWVKNALRYSKGMGNENKLDSYKYNTGPPIPLPEGELFFFADTKFNPESCPGTYSNSMGCAAMSQKQYNYLMMRGGNNSPPKNTNTAYFNEF
jgi:hypothetical protein